MSSGLVYAFGVLTGLAVLPAGLGVMTVIEWVRHGWWTTFRSDEAAGDHGCEACHGAPDDQWSPIHRCPRCGRRQVRGYLVRVLGGRLLDRVVKRGPRDEAWLNGETS